ncbi:MAG: ABC transporter permease [Deltaproteobacteria bacterium]|nr:ABC transporter permease [Deltaproteobacteria bacterium]
MNIGVIKAYTLKEFKELMRTRMIFTVYALPLTILVLFGYGIRMEVTHSRILIIDNDQSKLSGELVEKFKHSKYFNTTEANISESKALKLIKQAKKDAIIIIPTSFEKRLIKAQKIDIAIFIDGSFPNRAHTIENYIESVIINYLQNYAQRYPTFSTNIIAINPRSLFNQAMRDEDAIVPGLIGLALFVSPAILTALLIVKEKEKGTIFNFYASSINKEDFLIAKLIPPFLLHSVSVLILFLIAVYLFRVPFRGSFALYWFSSELYVLVSLSVGLLVSIVTRSQIVALVLTVIITILPGFLYSGIILPISSMSRESYIEAHMFPVMYYNHIAYDTFLIGQGLSSKKIVLYLIILMGFACVLLNLGWFLLKKELKK